jgi:putative ABC transport system permease protein
MRKVTLRGLMAHKRRLAGTFVAILLGVAFLSGTLVLSDTMRASFGELFAGSTAGTDAVVRSTEEVQSHGPPERAPISASLTDRVRAVAGVAAAQPSIEGYGGLVGKDGKAIGGNGPPRRAGNWIDDPDLNPWRLVRGRSPRGANEVVINRGAAEDGHLRVGDTVTVLVPEPVRVRIVGIATFGSADGFGPSTFTAFTLTAAQRHLASSPDRVSSIAVKADAGVSQDELVRRVRPVLPAGVEAIGAARLTDERIDTVSAQFLDLFRTFLLVFAAIALLVATFSIHNTFSIIVAQRTREAALLRAIGASRGQILGSFLLEALIVGLLASVAGLFGGLGVATLFKGMFTALGWDLPASGLVFTATTAVVSVGVGMAVTLAAGVLPAVKASRVPPLAALREVALDRSATSPARALAGITLTTVGVVIVVAAVLAAALPPAGVGALLTLIGVVVLGPVVARTASGIIGSPLRRLRGVTGSLARRNAMRNPRRTAATASALMVGVCVVTLFTVFAASLRASIDATVSKSFGGDLAISAGTFGGGGFSPRLAGDVSRLREVRNATGVGTGTASIGGHDTEISVADPGPLAAMLDLEVEDGSIRALANDQLAVSSTAADDEHWRLGTAVPVRFPDGTSTRLTVSAIYGVGQVFGDYLIPRGTWTPHAAQSLDSLVLVTLRDGVDVQAGKAAVETVARRYGDPDVQDREEYAATVAQGVDMMLSIVYALLALAIVIALMGIANTLALAIHERTRELGLLRAVGQTRGQLRSMVRWESGIIALFGTLGGLATGLFLGWAVVQAASQEDIATFTVPAGRLIVVLAVGAIAGVLAGIRPARRAARLRLLTAIANE